VCVCVCLGGGVIFNAGVFLVMIGSPSASQSWIPMLHAGTGCMGCVLRSARLLLGVCICVTVSDANHTMIGSYYLSVLTLITQWLAPTMHQC
jgi:hypothetical protein